VSRQREDGKRGLRHGHLALRLVLVRHGDIIHPGVAAFDEAILSEKGKKQMRELALHWPYEKPAQIFSSTLPRALQSAMILCESFNTPLRALADLREWSPSFENITEEEYLRREEECWRDHDMECDTGESINEAMERIRRGMRRVVEEAVHGIVAVVGHGMIFTMFLASVRGKRPDIEYKRRIKNAATAVVEHDGGGFRVVKDFV
jgi:broad specificity phosphatase PhoE